MQHFCNAFSFIVCGFPAYICQVKQKTRAYEKTQIEKFSTDKRTLKGFKRFLKYGILYKRTGIPYLFQIQKFFKDDKKLMVIKLFNVDIFKHLKNR